MEPRRFDGLTKAIASRSSRRDVVRRLGLGGLAAALAGMVGRRAAPAAARCRGNGCTCDGGAPFPCNAGLVCCPPAFGFPGGPGTCTTEVACYGPTCSGIGDACAGYCGYDAPCDLCCSGYCGDYGTCDQPSCDGPGCACDTGTYLPCGGSLVCCALNPGLPGGPGVCQFGC